MKIDSRGRVTIPREIRERLGWLPGTEVEWDIAEDHAVLRRASERNGRGWKIVEHMRGRGTAKMSTDEIMALTRGEE